MDISLVRPVGVEAPGNRKRARRFLQSFALAAGQAVREPLACNGRFGMHFVGVDGCRAGWFYFGLAEYGRPAFGIARNAAEVAALGAQAQLVLIDIPIGLREEGPDERLCDKEARRWLGQPRGSSVFRAPTRQALEAAGYKDACARNFAIAGKRLSRQGWAICAKIREIDQLLKSRPDLRPVFREMHPELCFWSLNGGRATVHSKKRNAGRRERIEILSKYLPDAESVIGEAAGAYRRKEVGVDDILDALAGAVTAWVGYGQLCTLPAEPERDSYGLPMEMVFSAPPCPSPRSTRGKGAQKHPAEFASLIAPYRIQPAPACQTSR